MLRKLKRTITQWLTQEHDLFDVPMCDFERIRYEIRSGDVLLMEGRSRVSEVIKQVTQSPWTHSALYLGRIHDIDDENLKAHVRRFYEGSDSEQLVIEGFLGKGTIITPLEKYRHDHIRICRPKGLSRQHAQDVIRTAIEHLGYDYDVRQIIDLWRFLVPWSILPRKWRSTLFQMNDSKTAKTVCSTMIARAFSEVNFPILPQAQVNEDGLELTHQNHRMITPKDFDYSPFFDIIKHPFLEYGETALYQDLPWKDKDEDDVKTKKPILLQDAQFHDEDESFKRLSGTHGPVTIKHAIKPQGELKNSNFNKVMLSSRWMSKMATFIRRQG